MRRAAWITLALITAACSQTGAPVVDVPVHDRGSGGAKVATRAHDTVAKPKAAAHPGDERPDADWRPDVYTVKKGDTLYGIALDHGQDYRDIAAWNKLTDPNVILVGQQLRVRAPEGSSESGDAAAAGVVTRPMPAPAPVPGRPLEDPAPPPLKKGPKAVKLPYSDKAFVELGGTIESAPVPAQPKPVAAAPAAVTSPPPSPGAQVAKGQAAVTPQPAASGSVPGAAGQAPPSAAKSGAGPGAPARLVVVTKSAAQTGWGWPAKGRVLFEFNRGPNPKGITIVGNAGDAVLATAGGRVVYSGSGLRGYGKLVIVKHDAEYLSVYAHNRELLVKEGQRVEKGQKIAEMGDSDADRVGLHFEIRRLGKPVDPLPFLQAGGAPAAASKAAAPDADS